MWWSRRGPLAPHRRGHGREGEIVWSTGSPAVDSRADAIEPDLLRQILTLDSMIDARPWVNGKRDAGNFRTYILEGDATAAAIFVPDRKLAVLVLIGGHHSEVAACLATALLVTSLGRPDLAQCTK